MQKSARIPEISAKVSEATFYVHPVHPESLLLWSVHRRNWRNLISDINI